jgi:hypothetical protein
MGGWCKERYNKDENNKLEGLHQKTDQTEENRWEGQNFTEVVAPQKEEEEDYEYGYLRTRVGKFEQNWTAGFWDSQSRVVKDSVFWDISHVGRIIVAEVSLECVACTCWVNLYQSTLRNIA